MAKEKNNKLNVYLIKEDYTDITDILKDSLKLKKVRNSKSGITYYYTDSAQYSPYWIKNFLLEDPTKFQIRQSSAQVIAIIKIEVESGKHRVFAIPFGMGYHLMNIGVYEERFGLKVVLNAVDEKMLKSIDKKNMTNVPKHAKEQISIDSEVSSFGINIEQDLILGVTGHTKQKEFGNVITGKDGLSISVKNNIENVKPLLLKIYNTYKKDDYKKNFGWIDYINECKDKNTIDEINERLIENIKIKKLDTLWMSVPEIIEWSDIEGFKFPKISDYLYEDISIHNFYDSLSDDDLKNIDVDYLKKNSIRCLSSSSSFDIKKWKIYDCIYAEISNNEILYMLTNGKYYSIESSFKTQIENEYARITKKKYKIILPDSKTDIEDEYNKYVASSNKDYCLMDKKMIYFGGGYSKIEFCDLYHIEKALFHIKVYGGSAVLSHLFNQAMVSSELFNAEKKFRDDVNSLLNQDHRLDQTNTINTNDYSVIVGILSTSKKPLNIPFFSKVSLKNVARQIESLGYNMYVQKISIIDLPPKKPKAKKARSKKGSK